MELQFVNIDGHYIAEIEAATHFNLHIEGGERVLLYKKTSGEEWSLSASLPTKEVLDADVAVSLPKSYRLVLQSKPSFLVITTADGTIYEGVFLAEGEKPHTFGPFMTSASEEFLGADGVKFYVRNYNEINYGRD